MISSTLGRRSALLVALVACSGRRGNAQFDTTGWKFAGEPPRIESYRGRDALVLRDGLAYLPTANFFTGTIAFDVALTDAPSFVGVRFRMQGADDYEDYYFRPQNSGSADATQYQPVMHGNTGWQIYVGDRYTAPVRFRPDEWMHVRLVVDSTQAAVFVDGAPTPAQYIPRLIGPGSAGQIALYAQVATARFANFRMSREATVLAARALDPLPVPAGAIDRWSVSEMIGEPDVAALSRLPDEYLRMRRWTTLRATERGIVNLGVVGKRTSAANTVLARIELTTERRRSVLFRFGYSDRARLYLNGRLLYTGNATYRSRDERFLGTVGLHDAVELPLEAGANTLVIAVSEDFGGWAVTGALENAAGVRTSSGPAPARR